MPRAEWNGLETAVAPQRRDDARRRQQPAEPAADADLQALLLCVANRAVALLPRQPGTQRPPVLEEVAQRDAVVDAPVTDAPRVPLLRRIREVVHPRSEE